MKKHLAFTPTNPIRRPDCIMSSKARETGNRGFIPTYLEKSEKTNMHHLMGNEYMRKWFDEREKFMNELYINRPINQADEELLRRRHVQKLLKPQKVEKYLPIITLKRFKKFSKTPENTENSAALRTCERYKVECYPDELKKSEVVQLSDTVTESKSTPVIPQQPEKTSDNLTDGEEKKVEKKLPAGFRRFRCKMFCPSQAKEVYD